MSQIPPPSGPLSYESAPLVPPKPRPTSVTVLAILAIIFGSLGVLGTLCNIPQYLGMSFGPNPVIDEIRSDKLLMSYMIGSLVLAMILSIALLWAGIGSLSLKRSARTTMIGYAIAYLIVGVIGLIMNLAVINPRTSQATQRAMAGNPQLNTPQMKALMQYSMYGGVCFGVVLMIWPVIILYYMTRPHVKAAFERGMGGYGLPPPGGP